MEVVDEERFAESGKGPLPHARGQFFVLSVGNNADFAKPNPTLCRSPSTAVVRRVRNRNWGGFAQYALAINRRSELPDPHFRTGRARKEERSEKPRRYPRLKKLDSINQILRIDGLLSSHHPFPREEVSLPNLLEPRRQCLSSSVQRGNGRSKDFLTLQ